MHSVCQQTHVANFSNSELQRHGLDVEGLLSNPNVRKFVDWVAKKEPDFTATMAKKQRRPPLVSADVHSSIGIRHRASDC